MIGSYEEAVASLKAARNAAVITHVNPDADAIGSAVATAMMLERLGASATMLVGQAGPVPENLATIPRGGEVRCTDTLPDDCDLVILVDCGAVDRAGLLTEQVRSFGNVLCIDHHASNDGFGTSNLVDIAESTTTILYTLCEMLGIAVDRDLAHAIYAGLMTDTGSFRWGRPQMHELAATLLETGIDSKQIAVDLLDGTTVNDLIMTGRVLSGIQVRQVGNHSAAILLADFETTQGCTDTAVETLVDYVRALEGTDVGAVFKERAITKWSVSLRSGSMDVSRLAGVLGGGGHIPAAGYTTTGPREAVVLEFLHALENYQ